MKRAPFVPESPIRRFAAEPVLLFGAQRALLLQLAHAKVAAGVAAHSEFREKPLSRLWGTADKVVEIVWGGGSAPHTAFTSIMAVHDRVHGSLPEAAGAWRAGDPYSAHDTDLMRWVWATLVETTEVITRRYVRPFRADEAEALYADWCTFAEWFGVPPRDIPRTRPEFVDYYQNTLHGPEIAVSATAVGVSRAILDPPLPLVPSPVKRVGAIVAAGLLPPHVRDAYALAWSDSERRVFGLVDRTVRIAYPHLPRARRVLPRSYVAAKRVLYAPHASGTAAGANT
ncbi:MAG: DUF2236 domain-containing protein [Acidimicrobiia bacterium]|nr:DUF2236 domain-containing protein [Acidimicrobiia bacterium]